jgi:hypothetical protein
MRDSEKNSQFTSKNSLSSLPCYFKRILGGGGAKEEEKEQFSSSSSYNEENDDGEESEEETVNIKHLSLKETMVMQLSLEFEDHTEAYMMNVNPKEKKLIIKLAKHNVERLIAYFTDHCFIMTEIGNDGLAKHYANREKFVELLSPSDVHEKDHGVEPYSPRQVRRAILYA